MNTSPKAQLLLERIAQIRKMERGKLCKMTSREHYNHQTWEVGRNVVKYVPSDDLSELQEAIDGYNQFKNLMKQYAEEIIRLTRKARRASTRKRKKNC